MVASFESRMNLVFYIKISFKSNLLTNTLVFFYSPQLLSAYGTILCGSLGNKLHILILGSPSQNCTIRSNPNPPPPCGGHPNLKPST